MLIKCVTCDGDLDEGEYLYKRKSYCGDCYKIVIENVMIVAEFYDRGGKLSDVNENFPSFGNSGPSDLSDY